jgi:hypothetical protein
MKDSEFLSGSFLDFDIPKHRRYLLKYFKTDLQKAFLRYYIVFESAVHFVDHTGRYCAHSVVVDMKKKYRLLTSVHEMAKKALTEDGMETVVRIEGGKVKLKELIFLSEKRWT